MKTRRILLAVAFATFVTNSLDAQLIRNVGIKVGATISDIKITSVTPISIGGQLRNLEFLQGSSVNPSIGVFTEMLNTEHLSLQTEVTYLRLGASKTYELTVTSFNDPDGAESKETFTSEIGLQYLQLRFVAQPKYALGQVVVYADVGPTFSYLLGAKNLGSIGNQLSKVQVGYTLGAGLNLGQLLDHNLFVEIKFAGDFRYFYDHPNAKLWNRSWMMCVGTTL